MLIWSSYIGKHSKFFLLALNAFFWEIQKKKWSFLWNMSSISERALEITGFWDFQKLVYAKFEKSKFSDVYEKCSYPRKNIFWYFTLISV